MTSTNPIAKKLLEEYEQKIKQEQDALESKYQEFLVDFDTFKRHVTTNGIDKYIIYMFTNGMCSNLAKALHLKLPGSSLARTNCPKQKGCHVVWYRPPR